MIDRFEPIVAGNRRLLFEFPECSDRADLEIRLTDDLVVLFKYHDAESDDVFWIRFDRTYAYQYYNQSVSNEFHVDHSIDQLVEILESEWRTKVAKRATASATIRHFLFFAEDHGALEVLASDYETGGRPPLPPEYQTEEDDER